MAYPSKYEYLLNKEELKKIIKEHYDNNSILNAEFSEQDIKISFSRAENELKQAEALFEISTNKHLKENLNLLDSDTFFSGAITHSYYSIFFAAKSLLQREHKKTKSPNIHKATLDAFSFFLILTGRLDIELFKIYKSNLIKADALLGLFLTEKEKRGTFTYHTLPDA
ncbi:hypothetical protein DRJ22_03175, partial [Candidatus Woesearchaeota archaeon]